VILSTSSLFARVLTTLRIDLVCDVGSLNGADALRFRRALPRAKILAFEANPNNYRAMLETKALQQARVATLPFAVAANNGEAEFFIVPVADDTNLARSGMSSLYQRSEPEHQGIKVMVQTRRLDTLLSGLVGDDTRIALWIDAEGAAFEVLEGATGVLDRVRLIHVEVETVPCIGPTQKLYRDVAALLISRGFIELAADCPADTRQFNALFVRAGLPASTRAALARQQWAEKLRRSLVEHILAVCPPMVRRHVQRRRMIPAAVRRGTV